MGSKFCVMVVAVHVQCLCGRRKRSCVCCLLIPSYLLCQKCDISEPLNFGNGKPTIPVLNDQTLPKFLESARVDKTVNRNDTRLKLFSGTANPALSQVSIQFLIVVYKRVMFILLYHLDFAPRVINSTGGILRLSLYKNLIML